jgi:hypothetical protein
MPFGTVSYVGVDCKIECPGHRCKVQPPQLAGLQKHFRIVHYHQGLRVEVFDWVELQKAFQAMGYLRSIADPCLYVRWDYEGKMCIWLTWIDDCVVISKDHIVARESAKLMSLFECEDVGPMEEYIGIKLILVNKS